MQAEALETAARALAGRRAAPDVLATLLDALRGVAPRGAIFLVRPEGLRGWNAFGHRADTAERLRRHVGHGGQDWVSRLALATDDEVAFAAGEASIPGGPPAAETMGATLRVRDKVVAVVACEREANETPWEPAALGTLVTVARLRLELSLAERRPNERPPGATRDTRESRSDDGESPAAAAATEAFPATGAGSDSPHVTRRAAAADPDDEPTALCPAPAEERPARSREVTAAQRFARLVATDIRLYNEEAVVLGRRHGDLVERLRAPLDRGRRSFLERHADLGDEGLAILHEAFVDVLAGGDAALAPELSPRAETASKS